MDISAQERLGDELRAHDRWGDFEVTRLPPEAKDWPEDWRNPFNLIVNGWVSADHFENYAPILVRALDQLTLDSGLDRVVRTLSRKGMTIAVDRLLKFFTDDAYVEQYAFLWAVGNAIHTISPRGYVKECINICRERKLGYSRHRLIVSLSRFKKSDEVFQTLLGLLEDESVRGAALEALKLLGDIRAIPAIERTPVRDGPEGVYETHQKKMALKKLNTKAGKPDKYEECGKGRHVPGRLHHKSRSDKHLFKIGFVPAG